MAPQAALEEVLGVIHRIPLFVFRCNETGKIVWFAPSFKDVPRNSVNTFLSLCSMTLLRFSLFMCLFFCSSQAEPVCEVSGLCYKALAYTD